LKEKNMTLLVKHNPPFSSFVINIAHAGNFTVRVQKKTRKLLPEGDGFSGYEGVLYVNKNDRVVWYKCYIPDHGQDVLEGMYKFFEGYLLGMTESPGSIAPFVPESDEILWELTA
jgi:hypothetical protein